MLSLIQNKTMYPNFQKNTGHNIRFLSAAVTYTFFIGKTNENNHLVTPSLWPFVTSQFTFGLVVALTGFMHGYMYSTFFLFFFFILGSDFYGFMVARCYS